MIVAGVPIRRLGEIPLRKSIEKMKYEIGLAEIELQSLKDDYTVIFEQEYPEDMVDGKRGLLKKQSLKIEKQKIDIEMWKLDLESAERKLKKILFE